MARTARQRYKAALTKIKNLDEKMEKIVSQLKERRQDTIRKLQEAYEEIQNELLLRKNEILEVEQIIDEGLPGIPETENSAEQYQKEDKDSQCAINNA